MYWNGESYKYHIHGFEGMQLDKGDPFANLLGKASATLHLKHGELDYEWKDDEWMKNAKNTIHFDAPWSVYEVHLASWMRPDKNDEESL